VIAELDVNTLREGLTQFTHGADDIFVFYYDETNTSVVNFRLHIPEN
jgi:hypothetical protein